MTTPVPSIPVFYILLERSNTFYFNTPSSSTQFHKQHSPQSREDSIATWLEGTDSRIKEIINGGEIPITNTVVNIQRRLHNNFNIAYKDVLDIEIVLREEQYLHRYPAEGRINIDFCSKLYQVFAEMGLDKDRILNNQKELYVFVLVSSSSERKTLSDLVERYLYVENRDLERKQIIDNQPYPSSNILNHPSFSSFSLPFTPIYQPSLNRMHSPIQPSQSSFGETPYSSLLSSFSQFFPFNQSNNESERKEFIENEEKKREETLSEFKRNIGQNDSFEIPLHSPNISPIQSLINSSENGDLEITYAVYPGQRPRIVNSRLIDENPFRRNLIDLLYFVNRIPIELIGEVNIENLMEPVRVTVNEENLKKFLYSFKYEGKESKEYQDIRIKEQDKCNICQNDFVNDEELSYIKTCNHLFHKECIWKWLKEYNHKCPVCRLSANPEKNNENCETIEESKK